MTISDTYASLALMLDYPAEKKKLQEAQAMVSSFLNDHYQGVSLATFARFADTSSLATLQEEYVATFDFNPATAPYLGHHLFGDNRKKGGYMIRLKQDYGRYGFVPPGVELPDHLAVVLGFLAHLAREEGYEVRKLFIAESVLPGMERMAALFADRKDSPWKQVVEAARQLCAIDCKEVPSC
jgi:nitrate reductase molybdenum cofactor assembly chaperone NarJ/NarW